MGQSSYSGTGDKVYTLKFVLAGSRGVGKTQLASLIHKKHGAYPSVGMQFATRTLRYAEHSCVRAQVSRLAWNMVDNKSVVVTFVTRYTGWKLRQGERVVVLLSKVCHPWLCCLQSVSRSVFIERRTQKRRGTAGDRCAWTSVRGQRGKSPRSVWCVRVGYTGHATERTPGLACSKPRVPGRSRPRVSRSSFFSGHPTATHRANKCQTASFFRVLLHRSGTYLIDDWLTSLSLFGPLPAAAAGSSRP